MKPSRRRFRGLNNGDRFDFDHRFGRIKRDDFHDGIRRIWLAEILAAQFNDLAKVGHVSQENRHFDDVLEIGTARDEGAIEVRERLFALSAKAACDDLPVIIVTA